MIFKLGIVTFESIYGDFAGKHLIVKSETVSTVSNCVSNVQITVLNLCSCFTGWCFFVIFNCICFWKFLAAPLEISIMYL